MQDIEFSICGPDGEVYLDTRRKGQFSLPDKDTLVRVEHPEGVVSGIVTRVVWTYATEGGEDSLAERVEIVLRDVQKVTSEDRTRARKKIQKIKENAAFFAPKSSQEAKAQLCIDQARQALGPDATVQQVENYALTLLDEMCRK